MKNALLALLLGLAGCDILGLGKLCTTSVEPALRVDVADSLSGLLVRGRYFVIARDGSYADTADAPFFPPGAQLDTLYFGPFPLAYERGGLYDLEIQAPTYRSWRQTGIRVTEGECHVRTISIRALLQRP